MPRPIHFEIHAENPERAIAFYTKIFDWKFQKWDGPMPYWVVSTGDKSAPGIDGGLLPRRGPAPGAESPVNAFVCTVDVPVLDDYMTKATSAGAGIALPKMAIPGVGWLGYIKDTEGNILGMMQNDPNAK